MTAELACPLTAIPAPARPVAGGKAAALGELAAAGLPVPPGYVVTTAAFRRALAEIDPDQAIPAAIERLSGDDPGAVQAAAAQARHRILAAPVPAAVADAVTSCYRDLGSPPVAVRSSATGEDSAAASFAGLADTYLWVQGEEAVTGHVRRCWASLYSAESVSYRRHQRLPEAGLAMAVVVQEMLEPRCAGVMFTRSPVTGDPSVIVVEASWGLGSALVSGDVTPDEFVVSKVTGQIVRRTVASKLRQHQRDPAGSGVLVAGVPPQRRDQPCLTDDEIQALARLGRRISEHYGCPQDIEWAALDTGEGTAARLAVLQSRPETVWSRRQPGPAGEPRARPVDHVLDWLRGSR